MDGKITSIKLKRENIEKLDMVREKSGRTKAWVINKALEEFFEKYTDEMLLG